MDDIIMPQFERARASALGAPSPDANDAKPPETAKTAAAQKALKARIQQVGRSIAAPKSAAKPRSRSCTRFAHAVVLPLSMLVVLLSQLVTLDSTPVRADQSLPPIMGTQRVVVVVSLDDRSGRYPEVRESNVAEFIRKHIIAELSKAHEPSKPYEKPRGDLPVTTLSWSDFRQKYASNWDLVLVWRMSIDVLDGGTASDRTIAVSYVLTYDFLDCNKEILQPQTEEQIILSSWTTDGSVLGFYDDLRKELRVRLTAVLRDLREDTYSDSSLQSAATKREEIASKMFSDVDHIEVMTVQGGLSVRAHSKEERATREGWTISTVVGMFDDGVATKRRVSVSDARGPEPDRSRRLEVILLIQDGPAVGAQPEFTYLTIGASLRWPRYPFDGLLTLSPITLMIPNVSDVYRQEYGSALEKILEPAATRLSAENQ